MPYYSILKYDITYYNMILVWMATGSSPQVHPLGADLQAEDQPGRAGAADEVLQEASGGAKR